MGLLLAASARGETAPPTTTPAPSALPTTDQGTQSARPVELSGELKSIDKTKRSLTIFSPSTGVRDLKLSASAAIVRDGSSASLDQLQEGDQVRASFDPLGKQATAIEVHSKAMKDKDHAPMKDNDKK
jgi:hypothetical protein